VVDFTLIGQIENIETFAIGRRIREVKRLRKKYGKGRWRKRKGVATVRLADGAVKQAELHWYEATGIGRRELKIKRYIE
jgi:hypothetical protein